MIYSTAVVYALHDTKEYIIDSFKEVYNVEMN